MTSTLDVLTAADKSVANGRMITVMLTTSADRQFVADKSAANGTMITVMVDYFSRWTCNLLQEHIGMY